MPPSIIKLGKQSGEHGSYSFYRSFSYQSGRKWRHVKLGRFFFVRIGKASPICIGELQLVWTGRYSPLPLASVRLYYLPEQLPDGRQSHHGQDELVATEKMVIHAKDLIKWIICEGVEWSLGLSLMSKDAHTTPSTASSNRKKCNKCRRNYDGMSCNVQIVDFTSYCKLRTALKRTAGKLTFRQILSCPKLTSIYDLKNIQLNKYIMFCKETFQCPELENHDFRCDHLAPNLKGRPRKKTKGKHAAAKAKHPRVNSAIGAGEDGGPSLVEQNSDSRDEQKEAERYEKVIRQILTNKEHFTRTLYKHMKDVGTPISKIPSLGFKIVDLHSFFKHAYSAGGYEEICKKRLWKTIYDKLGGNPHNTSAPSCTKKQYERLLLSFERNILLPGTAGKIKVPNLTSANAVQRKPRLKTRLEKIRKEWSSLVKPDRNPCAQKNLEDSSDSQQKRDDEGRLVIDDEAFDDEDQVPLASLLVKNTKNCTTSCTRNSAELLNQLGESVTSVVTPASAPIQSTQSTCISPSLPSDPHLNKTIKPETESNSWPGSRTGQFTANIRPAHGILKASMPLNVLGPCNPDQLTFGQRSPWITRLSINYYGSPTSFPGYTKVKRRHSCEEALDLSARKRMHLDAAQSASNGMPVDKHGAIDLTVNRTKDLRTDGCEKKTAMHPVEQNWKPQAEPINYSKIKAIPMSSIPFDSTPPLGKKVSVCIVTPPSNPSILHTSALPLSNSVNVPNVHYSRPHSYPSCSNTVTVSCTQHLLNGAVSSGTLQSPKSLGKPSSQPPLSQPPLGQPLLSQPPLSQPPLGQPLLNQPLVTTAVVQRQLETNYPPSVPEHGPNDWQTRINSTTNSPNRNMAVAPPTDDQIKKDPETNVSLSIGSVQHIIDKDKLKNPPPSTDVSAQSSQPSLLSRTVSPTIAGEEELVPTVLSIFNEDSSPSNSPPPPTRTRPGRQMPSSAAQRPVPPKSHSKPTRKSPQKHNRTIAKKLYPITTNAKPILPHPLAPIEAVLMPKLAHPVTARPTLPRPSPVRPARKRKVALMDSSKQQFLQSASTFLQPPNLSQGVHGMMTSPIAAGAVTSPMAAGVVTSPIAAGVVTSPIAAGVVFSTYHPGLVVQPSNLTPHSTHQRLASEPATSVTHMHPSLQRLPTNSSISSSSPYEHFLPSYALPAPPRLQPIPSRHNHPSATFLQPKNQNNS